MVFWIALGSALGGASRYLFGGMIQRLAPGEFPLGTLAINVSGSLLLGFIVRYAFDTPAVSTEVRAFLTIGFCGGFTTFSTFSFESAVMLQKGEWSRLALYAGLSLALTIAAALAGFALAGGALSLRRSL
jgi:fluoride exporter